uniref:Ig-like domain-containing protein n=1 Tax=Esox lucius TaxID=8010 RepID=A0A6Q2X8L2_ESOLU
ILFNLLIADIFMFFAGSRAEDSVTQPTEDVMAVEGQSTTLSCKFTTDQTPYLFWYKQQGNSNPVFMMRRDKYSSGETDVEFENRFHAHLNVTTKSVPLMIQRLHLSDSAVYYCALRPTSGQTERRF